MNTTIKTMMLALVAAFAFSMSANAVTFAVNTTADTQDATPGDGICSDGAACSLRAAITEANALAGPDVITLPAGTYTQTLVAAGENVNAGGDFDITSEITINGGGAATTIIQANAAPDTATERVVHCITAATAVVINDVTLRHGRTASAVSGAGLRLETATTNVTLNRVTITANRSATVGGGISFLTAGIVCNINNSTISNNFAGSSVAGSASQGAAINCTLAGTVNLTGTTITGNTTDSPGGGGANSLGGAITAVTTLTITKCTISNNTATSAVGQSLGSGLYSAGTTTISNSTISNNTATSSASSTFGGGVVVAGGTTTITDSTISGNASNVTAGAGAGFAGGIYNQGGTLNLISSSVTGNNSSHFHSGIRSLASTVATTTNITDSTVSNNVAVLQTGGITNYSVGAAACITNITRSTISGNSASGPTGAIGGIENISTVPPSPQGSTATVNLTNSTVSGNTSPDVGGIFSDGNFATINLNYSTVAANSATGASPAGTGGGLQQGASAGGVTNLKNSIVADNTAPTAGPDISGTITSQDFNHVEDTTGGTFATMANDVTGTDPGLGALANNGGPTFTHLPGAGSPVLNTIAGGASDCGTTVTVDQRSLPRPFGGACDKGSVEVQSPTAIAASSAVSRKVHGGIDRDVNLPLTGTPGIEPRGPGPGLNPYQIVITFANPVTVSGSTTPPPTAARLTATTGGSTGPAIGNVGSITVAGSVVTVNLTNVATQQRLTLTLFSVVDTVNGNNGDIDVPMNVLVGDTAGIGNGTVNAADISFVKQQTSPGSVNATNFRADVTVNNSINAGDISLVKAKSGNTLPPP
jgi:CSLREA domain-containing protein